MFWDCSRHHRWQRRLEHILSTTTGSISLALSAFHPYSHPLEICKQGNWDQGEMISPPLWLNRPGHICIPSLSWRRWGWVSLPLNAWPTSIQHRGREKGIGWEGRISWLSQHGYSCQFEEPGLYSEGDESHGWYWGGLTYYAVYFRHSVNTRLWTCVIDGASF